MIELVTKAQSGDQNALNDLFNESYNDVYYFALKTVKDEDLACDITQETFMEIIKSLHTLKEPAAFFGWTRQVAFSKATRYFNKQKDVLVEEDEEGFTLFDNLTEDKTEFIPDEALEQDEFKKIILFILDTLSEEQRSAIMMYYFDELSIREIADIQGVSEGTVKSRLNYGRKAVKTSAKSYDRGEIIQNTDCCIFVRFGGLAQSRNVKNTASLAAGKYLEKKPLGLIALKKIHFAQQTRQFFLGVESMESYSLGTERIFPHILFGQDNFNGGAA